MKDLHLNRDGLLSKSQRRWILGTLAAKGGCLLSFGLPGALLFLVGLLVLIASIKNEIALQSVLSLVLLMMLIGVLFLLGARPYFRAVRLLLGDIRDGRVLQDCGILTFEVYHRYGRQGGAVLAYSLIRVDDRSYLWTGNIQGGFKTGEKGCVYYTLRANFVVSIETFENGWGSNEMDDKS